MSSNRNAMGILIAVQSVRKRCICRRYWIRCFFLLQPVAQFSNEDASFLINRRIPIGIEGNNRIRKGGLNKQVAANSHDEKHYHLSSVTWTWVTSSIMDRIGNRKKLKDSNLFPSLHKHCPLPSIHLSCLLYSSSYVRHTQRINNPCGPLPRTPESNIHEKEKERTKEYDASTKSGRCLKRVACSLDLK